MNFSLCIASIWLLPVGCAIYPLKTLGLTVWQCNSSLVGLSVTEHIHKHQVITIDTHTSMHACMTADKQSCQRDCSCWVAIGLHTHYIVTRVGDLSTQTLFYSGRLPPSISALLGHFFLSNQQLWPTGLLLLALERRSNCPSSPQSVGVFVLVKCLKGDTHAEKDKVQQQ